jgi:hypothetical protein
MPTIVDSLSQKIVTQVSVGLEFIVSLGQDFDEYGQPFEEPLP